MKEMISKLMAYFKGENTLRVCPVCNEKDITFLPLPSFYKEMAIEHGYERFGQGEMISLAEYSCSSCGASDRERIYAYWLDEMVQKERFKKETKLVHFAPEASLSNKLKKSGLFDYKTADFTMENVDYVADLMNLPFDDSSFDLFICSHVLEHVEDDDKAINELYRITGKGGCGILVAPISVGLEKTLEDPSIVTESERWKYFGQNDHLRLYAHNDYVSKIKSHGFTVKELGVDYFGENIFRMLGMTKTSILYIVEKS